MLILLGIVSLYYLLRNPTRKILWPQTGANFDHQIIRPVVRKTIYGIALLVGLSAGYFVYDISQAKHMAADACQCAKQGLPLEDYLSKYSENDYKIIRSAVYIMIVLKRGFGRYHCSVSHDGQKITGSKTGFND